MQLLPDKCTNVFINISDIRALDLQAAIRLYGLHHHHYMMCHGYEHEVFYGAGATVWNQVLYNGEETLKLPYIQQQYDQLTIDEKKTFDKAVPPGRSVY